jgi:hypothetical protein
MGGKQEWSGDLNQPDTFDTLKIKGVESNADDAIEAKETTHNGNIADLAEPSAFKLEVINIILKKASEHRESKIDRTKINRKDFSGEEIAIMLDIAQTIFDNGKDKNMTVAEAASLAVEAVEEIVNELERLAYLNGVDEKKYMPEEKKERLEFIKAMAKKAMIIFNNFNNEQESSQYSGRYVKMKRAVEMAMAGHYEQRKVLLK